MSEDRRMLERGDPCPQCPSENPGEITLAIYVPPEPERHYNKFGKGPASYRYQCSRGHDWTEPEKDAEE